MHYLVKRGCSTGAVQVHALLEYLPWYLPSQGVLRSQCCHECVLLPSGTEELSTVKAIVGSCMGLLLLLCIVYSGNGLQILSGLMLHIEESKLMEELDLVNSTTSSVRSKTSASEFEAVSDMVNVLISSSEVGLTGVAVVKDLCD